MMKNVIYLLCVSTVLCTVPETAHIHILEDLPNCTFPDLLPIQIHIDNDLIDCMLSRNPDISTEVPTYIIQTTATGHSVVVPLKSQLPEKSSAYQNKDYFIAVIIKCSILDKDHPIAVLEGSITYNGTEYTITKSHRHRRQTNNNTGNNNDEEYTLHKQTVTLPQQQHDSKEVDEFPEMRKQSEIFDGSVPRMVPRYKRDDDTEYFIDIIMVVDYSIYRFWYLNSKSSDRSTDAQNNIRLYYAIVANGMNLRYKSIVAEFQIHVRLTGIIIAESPSGASWTENIRKTNIPRDQVNADDTLEAFRTWVRTTDSLPLYDHVMLFTRYDLFSLTGGQKSTSTAGLAFIGAVCDTLGQATSVVEDEGGYQSIETATHELGHSLGAKHDGMSGVCSDSDRYIMTAGSYKSTPLTLLNPWKFSDCSITYFRTRLQRISRTNRGNKCLLATLPVPLYIPEVEAVMPGQLYTPDTICRQIYGPSSRMCKGVEFGELKDICASLFCLDPYSKGSCYKQVAPRGLSCGNKKWCIDGQCVIDFKAPTLDESCPFGDVGGPAFNGSTCEEFITTYPAYCYNKLVRGRCCSTCEKYYTGVYACEYGDKGYGCDKKGCGLRDTKGKNYSATCCGTCNYRLPVPPTSTRRTSTLQLSTPSSQGVCVDVKTNIIGDSNCLDVVSFNPGVCYNAHIQEMCCNSCRYYRNDNPHCPYGDMVTDCNPGWCGINYGNGTYYDEKCCEACDYRGGTPVRPTPLPPSTSKLSTRPRSSSTFPPSSSTPAPSTLITTIKLSSATNRIPLFSSTPAPSTSKDNRIPTPNTSPKNPITSLPCEMSSDDWQYCQTVVSPANIQSCYNTSIEARCCALCSQYQDSRNPDCRYGDKNQESCKRRLLAGESCSYLKKECCSSCSKYVDAVSGATMFKSSIVLILLTLCSVLRLLLSY